MPSGSNLKAPIEWGVEQRGGLIVKTIRFEGLEFTYCSTSAIKKAILSPNFGPFS